MRCLYSRFKRYPNCVTKVLETLLRYLDTRKAVNTPISPQIAGSYGVDGRSAGVSPALVPASAKKAALEQGLGASVGQGADGTSCEGRIPSRQPAGRRRRLK